MSDLTVHAGGEVQDDVAMVAVRRRAAPSTEGADEDGLRAATVTTAGKPEGMGPAPAATID